MSLQDVGKCHLDKESLLFALSTFSEITIPSHPPCQFSFKLLFDRAANNQSEICVCFCFWVTSQKYFSAAWFQTVFSKKLQKELSTEKVKTETPWPTGLVVFKVHILVGHCRFQCHVVFLGG